MSSELIIAHINEAMDLIESIEDKALRQSLQDQVFWGLYAARSNAAALLGANETTRLIDAEEVLFEEEWDPYEDLADEFWHMYGDADDTFGVEEIDQEQFEAIIHRMPADEASFYANSLNDQHDAVGRDAIFDIIIDKWGNP